MAFPKTFSFASLAYASLLTPIRAQNVFINPQAATSSLDFCQNDVFPLGSSPLLQWTTNHEAYNLLLWQQNLTTGGLPNAGPSIFAKAPLDVERSSFKWNVQSYQFDLNKSNVFYLALTPTENATAGFESHFFNITAASPTPTPTPTPLPSSPLATSNATAPLPSPSSHDLAIGLGIALPLICMLGLAIGYYIGVRRAMARSPLLLQQWEQGSEKTLSASYPQSFDHAVPEVVRGYPRATIHEAPGVCPILEAPSGKRGTENGLPDTAQLGG